MKITKINSDAVYKINQEVKTRFELMPLEAIEELIIKTYEAQDKGLIKQRKQKPSVVNRYVRDILNGDWQINPQPVVITDRGYVIDGMHRLLAASEAKTAMIFNVTRNWPSTETFKVIDVGTPRSLGQLLSMEGVTFANKRIAITRALAMIALGGDNKNYLRNLSISELERIARPAEKSINTILELAHEHGAITKYTGETHGAIVYLHTTMPELALSFAESLYKLDLAKGTGPWALKRWYEKQSGGKGFSQGYASEVAANALKVWTERGNVEFVRGSKESLQWLAKTNPKIIDTVKSVVGYKDI